MRGFTCDALYVELVGVNIRFTTLRSRTRHFESLPDSVWFVWVTTCTIGYGEIVPQSGLGKAITSVLILASALYRSIPIGIVGKTFGEVWDIRDKILLAHRVRSRLFSRGYTAHDIPTMFKILDDNSDGSLGISELTSLLHKLQVEVSDARAADLFHSIDDDKSGEIDDREFVMALVPERYADIYDS